jgi:uncharacterized protein YggE
VWGEQFLPDQLKISVGGNTFNGVSFALEEPEPALDLARREAVFEARRRAELYADAACLEVARISESDPATKSQRR